MTDPRPSKKICAGIRSSSSEQNSPPNSSQKNTLQPDDEISASDSPLESSSSSIPNRKPPSQTTSEILVLTLTSPFSHHPLQGSDCIHTDRPVESLQIAIDEQRYSSIARSLRMESEIPRWMEESFSM